MMGWLHDLFEAKVCDANSVGGRKAVKLLCRCSPLYSRHNRSASFLCAEMDLLSGYYEAFHNEEPIELDKRSLAIDAKPSVPI